MTSIFWREDRSGPTVKDRQWRQKNLPQSPRTDSPIFSSFPHGVPTQKHSSLTFKELPLQSIVSDQGRTTENPIIQCYVTSVYEGMPMGIVDSPTFSPTLSSPTGSLRTETNLEKPRPIHSFGPYTDDEQDRHSRETIIQTRLC